MIKLPQNIKLPKIKKKQLRELSAVFFWFTTGIVLATFLLASFSFMIFQKANENKVYPGIKVAGIDFSGKKEEEVKKFFDLKNQALKEKTITLKHEAETATISAENINLGFDSELLSKQAMELGRGKNPITNLGVITFAYVNGIDLSPSYRFSEDRFYEEIELFSKKVEKEPVDAVFAFENGRVVTFKLSENGISIDKTALNKQLIEGSSDLIARNDLKNLGINVPIKITEPEITTDKVNNLGIMELIGSGTSLFRGSIESRIFNINLATSRINGVLVPPGEIFSFNEALGDVSSFTGYKQAYVIQNGRTVLGDGGGVCQVSTTFFRAVLNAGLPIEERNPHAYRVSYYEQDSPPGLDATIYVPSVDLKFKNDTEHHILVQSEIDPYEQRLTFYLYGTKDGREVTITKPTITSQSPAPEPKYEDDPTLPAGIIKQVDFAAAGANVYFERFVKKDGKVILSDKFISNYRPWQAVFLRGTKTE